MVEEGKNLLHTKLKQQNIMLRSDDQRGLHSAVYLNVIQLL